MPKMKLDQAMAKLDEDDQMVILVVPQDRDCFLSWCDKWGLDSHSPQIRFVTSTYRMRGHNPDLLAIFLLCDWSKRLSLTGTTEVINIIQHYESLDVPTFEDTCDA